MPELMKGKVFHERKHTVKYPCIAEVKYDEIRVHVKYHPTELNDEARSVDELMGRVEFLSYAGKPLANLGLYSQMFLQFFRESGLTELDMGFEANWNFNDSYRWVRSTKGLPADLVGKPVKWYLFDAPEMPQVFEDRQVDLHLHQVRLRELGLECQRPTFSLVTNESQLDMFFAVARRAGYEGLMVKSLDHTYQRGKRIDGWLKMKPEAEADGLIVGFTEAISEDGVPLGRVGSVTIRMEDNSLASPHGISHELATHMWQNQEQYLNKQWVQMNYMERDRQGGYRHPTFGRLRDAKT